MMDHKTNLFTVPACNTFSVMSDPDKSKAWKFMRDTNNLFMIYFLSLLSFINSSA